jgi:hypothetical protein
MSLTYNILVQSSDRAQQYSQDDLQLVSSFEVKSTFNPTKHFIEAGYYIEGELLELNRNYLNYRILSDSEIAGRSGATRLVLDPIEDITDLSYNVPLVQATYRFYDNLFSETKTRPKFYIEAISESRTEILLVTTDLQPTAIETYVSNINTRLQADSTFADITALFGEAVEVIAVAIDTVPFKNTRAVALKLYEPLPEFLTEKADLEIVELIADSISFFVESITVSEPIRPKRLAEPNFNLEELQETNLPTPYLNLDELLSTDETYSKALAEISTRSANKSAELNIDYSTFSNFVNFSSAVERLKNFKYKLELIESYEDQLDRLSTTPSAIASKSKLQSLIEGILRNFDHYEKFLYFEKSEDSWPKTGTNKPYQVVASTNTTAVNWYNAKLEEALEYDINNVNVLVNTVPQYIREDERNEPYTVFIHMIGHHFDNLWIYAKALTSKYDADNRLEAGLSKDLIEEVLKNFGVKLYSSTTNVDDLFRYFTLDTYELQGEVINTDLSVEGLQTSQEVYMKSIYKRLYHNLPLLLKTKGTERSIKVLITSFGIPTDILPVKLYGGVDRRVTPYIAQDEIRSGSLDKIKILDNTPEQKTLSYYTEIQNPDTDYTEDLHRIEVGYSPADYVNNYLLDRIDELFDIDTYIGDPQGVDYLQLKALTRALLDGLTRYDLKDFVRLIKFFDNRLFKMIRDFTPARAVVDTGIIIKPHLLERNRGTSVTAQSFGEQQFASTSQNLNTVLPIYIHTGSIETAFIAGSNAGAFDAKAAVVSYTTDWTASYQTPDGIRVRPIQEGSLRLLSRTDGETPTYTGEFSGSELTVTTGELNTANLLKKSNFRDIKYNTKKVDLSGSSCECGTGIIIATSDTSTWSRTLTSITFRGNLSSTGNFCFLSERGFVYSKDNTTPVLNQENTLSVTASGTGVGLFSATAANLDPDTVYYARAFVRNQDSSIVCYGSVLQLQTDTPVCTPFAGTAVRIKTVLAGVELFEGGTDCTIAGTTQDSNRVYLDVAQMSSFFTLNSSSELVIDNTSLQVPLNVNRYTYIEPSLVFTLSPNSLITGTSGQVPLSENNSFRVGTRSLLNPAGPGVTLITNSSDTTVNFIIC